MLRHDACRDDNQAGNGGHNMYLTLAPPITKPTPPESKLIHPCEKVAARHLRKAYVCKKDLGEKVDQAFSYEEFPFI